MWGKNKKKEIDKTVLEFVCEFWKRQLVKGEHDNGDNSFEGFVGMFWANQAAKDNQPSKEQFEIFEGELKNQINNREYDYLQTYCDYGPGTYLYEAAEKAKIHNLCFPFKTGVCFEEDSVIETMPYVKKTFSERIIYCPKKYILDCIKKNEDYLKDLAKKKFEYYETEEEREKTRHELQEITLKELNELKEFLTKFENDFYVREDYRGFYSELLKKEK